LKSSIHTEALKQLDAHYTARVKEHGDAPAAVQWRDRATQERRMAILAEVGVLRTAKLLDFACGTGHLLTFLREHLDFSGEYVGYDLSEAMLDLARQKHPEARFERRNIFEQGLPEDFDFILVSGVFNNRVDDNQGMMHDTLSILFPHIRRALAFNALSCYVDHRVPELSYISPEDVFSFCMRTLSPNVTLRHDYDVREGVAPFEFAVYVYATEHACLPPMTDET